MVVYRRRLFFFPKTLGRETGYPWLLLSILGVIFQGAIGITSEARLLTSVGYAALYPDSIMEDNNPIKQIVGVTLPAVNRAIEMGFADKNRIGVWGHSYGAYGVMALVTQTRAFPRRGCQCAVRNQHDQYLSYAEVIGMNRVVRGEASAKWWQYLGETRCVY